MAEVLPALREMRKLSRLKLHKKNASTIAEQINTSARCALQPALVTDDSETILFVNKHWEALFDCTLREAQGKSIRNFLSVETPVLVYEKMWRALHGRQLFQTAEIIGQKKTGSAFSMQTTIFCLQYGARFYYLQLLHDIKDID